MHIALKKRRAVGTVRWRVFHPQEVYDPSAGRKPGRKAKTNRKTPNPNKTTQTNQTQPAKPSRGPAQSFLPASSQAALQRTRPVSSRLKSARSRGAPSLGGRPASQTPNKTNQPTNQQTKPTQTSQQPTRRLQPNSKGSELQKAVHRCRQRGTAIR